MARRASSFFLRIAVASVALTVATASAAFAQEAMSDDAMAPVPRMVIYPGDIIRDDMLMDVPVREVQGAIDSMVRARSSVVGKMARRTLLPGRAIMPVALNNPRAVVNGAEVKLVYIDGGLTIVTSAAALQDGAVGDTIKVRNVDSGLTISGVIQSDGSVRVSGG
ncbi:MAG: flagellar basal body P-ring formation protein FlgA [Acetobacteraceae bacterium]|nr:flagellar basal body P-ring formation protein FlgA [Acetobacteraceae bacterium]